MSELGTPAGVEHSRLANPLRIQISAGIGRGTAANPELFFPSTAAEDFCPLPHRQPKVSCPGFHNIIAVCVRSPASRLR